MAGVFQSGLRWGVLFIDVAIGYDMWAVKGKSWRSRDLYRCYPVLPFMVLQASVRLEELCRSSLGRNFRIYTVYNRLPPRTYHQNSSDIVVQIF